jgi:hypothetical protein
MLDLVLAAGAAAAKSSSGPQWWQTAVTALAGGVVGGTISGVATAVNDSRKAKLSRVDRTQERLRDVSIRFLTALSLQINAIVENKDVSTVDTDVFLAWNELPTLASKDVLDTATEMLRAYNDVLLQKRLDKKDKLVKAFEEYHRCRELYVAALRKTNGLGELPGDADADLTPSEP